MKLTGDETLIMDRLWSLYLQQPGTSPADGAAFTERFYAWVDVRRAEKAVMLGDPTDTDDARKP